MSTTYTWSISQMDTVQTPQPDYVFSAKWFAYGVDGDYAAGIGGTTILAPSQGSTFIPYADLTEADVVGWVQSTLGEAGVADVENRIQLAISQQITFSTASSQNTPLPWVQE